MKKLISFCIGITLLASPVLVSAQTTSTNNVGVIAALEQLVATLTQELQSLLTAQRQSTPSTKQNSPSNFTALSRCLAQQPCLGTTATHTLRVTLSTSEMDHLLGLAAAEAHTRGCVLLLQRPHASIRYLTSIRSPVLTQRDCSKDRAQLPPLRSMSLTVLRLNGHL